MVRMGNFSCIGTRIVCPNFGHHALTSSFYLRTFYNVRTCCIACKENNNNHHLKAETILKTDSSLTIDEILLIVYRPIRFRAGTLLITRDSI